MFHAPHVGWLDYQTRLVFSYFSFFYVATMQEYEWLSLKTA
jgi:hypothetical protein